MAVSEETRLNRRKVSWSGCGVAGFATQHFLKSSHNIYWLWIGVYVDDDRRVDEARTSLTGGQKIWPAYAAIFFGEVFY